MQQQKSPQNCRGLSTLVCTRIHLFPPSPTERGKTGLEFLGRFQGYPAGRELAGEVEGAATRTDCPMIRRGVGDQQGQELS